MRAVLLPLVSLFSFLVHVQCESYFILPATYDDSDNVDNNPRYKIGDSIKIKWVTDLSYTTITAVQYLLNDTQRHYAIEQNTTESASSWTVGFDQINRFDKEEFNGSDAVLWFELYTPDFPRAGAPIAVSRSFNISVSDTDSTKSSSSSTSDPASSTDSSTDSDSSSGISAGAGAGIAIGAVVGVLLIGAVGFLLWRHFRKDKSTGHQSPPHSHYYQQPQMYGQTTYQPDSQYSSPHEVPAAMEPELHSDPARVHEAP
ncbi:crumbs 3 [Fusarium heterosporum]|uniref:Crumbs 3 n=1 Tax=Fusarium heterosporum TaxID=42747 RepID=A0A8H5TWZ3_FUSHE|nr:crumbs 3 [Fusarium heterosporum]